ncbi:MAG: hypothetical protein JXQ96_01460 [Cyclobacteriaceae bacterium]
MDKTKTYPDPFMPIDPDYTEIIEAYISEEREGKVFYFDPEEKLNDTTGKVLRLEKTAQGVFLHISSGQSVRVDKIITLVGRPGPAYDAYDRYANACLSCEDLGQFGT